MSRLLRQLGGDPFQDAPIPASTVQSMEPVSSGV